MGLIKIALVFHKFLKIGVLPVDILFAGSNCGYNFSKFSDVDLHLLYDFELINKDGELVKEYLDCKKDNWNDTRNITVHEYPVEVYCQSILEKNASLGVYSLVKGKWLKKPKPNELHLDWEASVKKAKEIMRLIDANKSSNISKLNSIKDKIQTMRSEGLERQGEYSPENIAFKILRRNGYLGKLKKLKTNAIEKQLSFESI